MARYAAIADAALSLAVRNDVMTNLMRWINRSLFSIVAEPAVRPSVDHVDGTHLAETDFWASASMRFDETPLDDFCETLPAFSLGSAARVHAEFDRAA